MLCRIFHSQGVQPARTLQLSYHTAQGSGTETGFTAAGSSLLGEARGWAGGVRICLCAHVGASMCECLFVLILAVCVCMCVFAKASVVEQLNRLVSGLELGAPNSVAAKVRSAAVPVNDV